MLWEQKTHENPRDIFPHQKVRWMSELHLKQQQITAGRQNQQSFTLPPTKRGKKLIRKTRLAHI